MIRIRRGVVAALLALTLPLPLMGAAVADTGTPRTTAAGGLELPRPSGAYAVGMETLRLRDVSRTDHWVPAAGARELMVSVHYPGRRGTGKPAARPYMTVAEARELLGRTSTGELIPVGNEERLSAVRTHAREGVRPARGKFPLVVLSPGFGLSRMTLTLLAEELASEGHVVASVDHAYESEATEFPDKGVLPCTACRTTEAGEVSHTAVPEGRAKDVSFVLDQLTGRKAVWRHSGMIDARKVGMAGHSIGGNSAAHTMATDRRVRAGINMDGTFFTPVPEGGLGGRPFMMLGAAESVPGSPDVSWDRDWRRLDGWKRWITPTGSHHFTFVDAPYLADQVEGAPQYPGVPSGKRSAEITRDYVSAFFAQHLKRVPQPLLDGPSPRNPEVVFHQP
ncbi:alpha/beta hydrolase family protein [Streptomyces inusitatus]|uniref:alpha/beta hydrolase family protein n=1 Tax=Streptomyces inusitatus TaxID=68221 RepID=UPI00167DC412|nr:alpha/beta hydrolase [Streptomyces inusitatus]